MTKKKLSITWEKWEDPFAPQEDYIEDYSEEYIEEYAEDLTEEEYQQLVEDVNEAQSAEHQVPKYRFILTPFGAVSPDQISIGKYFKFWIGHTNFDITSQVSDIIEKTEGVEVLNVYTRYRFRIGIGHCFKDRNVMSYIQEKVNELS